MWVPGIGVCLCVRDPEFSATHQPGVACGVSVLPAHGALHPATADAEAADRPGQGPDGPLVSWLMCVKAACLLVDRLCDQQDKTTPHLQSRCFWSQPKLTFNVCVHSHQKQGPVCPALDSIPRAIPLLCGFDQVTQLLCVLDSSFIRWEWYLKGVPQPHRGLMGV